MNLSWKYSNDDPLFEFSVDVDYNHDKSSSQRGVVNPSLVDTACSALSGPQPPQTGPEKRCSLFQSRPATSVDGEPDGIVAAILVDTLPGKISQLRVCCLVSWKSWIPFYNDECIGSEYKLEVGGGDRDARSKVLEWNGESYIKAREYDISDKLSQLSQDMSPQCLSVSVSQCLSVSVSQCLSVSVSQCLSVSFPSVYSGRLCRNSKN
ncbi:hypothetical protein LXG23DRAFT_36052 [Yarrowia lipolytica]|nr:hypothetical protein BKA91DRAFT_167098 [Yarrowia lipolytica]KAE8170908.1 hypothetical protein BKA90DRAFT_169734 [Yarrowia lipolytica]KAJ8053944.1 hypothetical protein LXG23DRAFT_36052 [Yarrowia lipolytica]RMI99225.1 hypothetical protein BD777DRAFT_134014 [Yarrowia lipolytica]